MNLPNPIPLSRLHIFFTSLGAAFIVALFALSTTPSAQAQSPAPVFVPIALAPTQRDTPVELVALTLDADISESNGHTFITGNSTFKLHNTDTKNDLQVSVGFPTWAGETYSFDPNKLSNFVVTVEGTRVRTLTPAQAEVKIRGVIRSVDWYTFTVSLAADEKKAVRYEFQQDLGDSMTPQFTYGLYPATDWKNSIGSARLTLRFPDSTTPEQIIKYDPPDPDFDGASLTWHFSTKEPSANPTFTFMRPSLWSDLIAKRRAAQQNPNDANAHTALGNLMRQLAAMDSPKQDSYYGQAIAELEAAVRLDPNNKNARQGLGVLYESRAGPATGPRQPAYVQLAVAQWEPLAASDATVRKQLAEDYFYLGLDAQTRGAFSDAAAYFDKASALAPNGAGPLFVADRAAVQRRALNIAWARALIEKNDATTAAQKARAALGDSFMATFKPPSFYVIRAQVNMAPHSRQMIFTLIPLQSAEAQNTLSGAITALRAAGVDAELAQDNSTYQLAITVPFENDSVLTYTLGALAKTLPENPEWALVRAVFLPNAITWNEADELFTRTTRYQEQVDLSSACSTFNTQLSSVSQNLAPLENVAASNDEAQLKRDLLKYAQRGWQSALANGRVTFQAGSEESRVDTCSAKTIAASTSTLRPERIAVIVAVLEVIGVAILIVRWRRHQRRQKQTPPGL